MAITHFHYDHLGDLPALLLALKYGVEEPRTEPLTLVGPPGFAGHLRRLSDAHGIAFLDQAFELRIAEMAPGSELVDAAFGLTWRCAKTVHTEESVAYALHGGWGSVAYTGDTGPSDELAGFLAGHDVLVAECSHPDPPPTGLHLTPSTLAGLATVARPELLVVTHVYPSLGPREAVSRLAERYGGRVVAGADGLRVRIRRGDVAVDLPTGPV